ncbi:MAG: hypothetical protein IMX06_06935 [Kyrpidia tusciae]|nr:hypothetical protein [Kyrpidia tusciae]MBE3552579.1 hypothetical protein [Kyrpidia tusciae]
MAYAIFWTLVVIAVAIALGYFFVNPRDENRGRSEARWKDRSALDTEFSQWLGPAKRAGGPENGPAPRTGRSLGDEGTPSGGVAGSGPAGRQSRRQ